MRILNLTQHAATEEQIAVGVVEPFASRKKVIQELLTFDAIPSKHEIEMRGSLLAYHAADTGVIYAMIGGAPYLMGPLEAALRAKGITPLYSFTKREVVEVPGADGSVVKTAIFKHIGWVEV